MNLTRRNKWTYSIGGLGRDMMFILVSMYTLSYIQFTMSLSVMQFSAISAIMIFARVWDGINDPMMGMVIENSHFKSGKFRPWIMIGGLLNFVSTILLFTIRPSGWLFVVFFGVVYISWGMTFTINDIAYWSMLPNLAKDNDTRNKLTNLMIVFASLGQFLAGGLIPVLVTGNAVFMYKVIGISISFIFLAFTCLTFFGVVENPRSDKQDKISVKDMFSILFNNDQLRVMTVVTFLHTIASGIFVALGLNFFYFEFGYGGDNIMIFTVIFALGTLSSLGVFSVLSERMQRAQIITISGVFMFLGYISFFINGFLFEIQPFLVYTSGFLVFFGVNLFFVVMVIMTANTIEYNEYKTGARNESVIFSVRPLMTKIGAAAQQMIVTLTLIVFGIINISRKIAELEIMKSEGLITDITSAANALLSQSTWFMKFGIRIGMVIVPFVCMLIAYILVKKKYIIDEAFFDEITSELNRKSS